MSISAPRRGFLRTTAAGACGLWVVGSGSGLLGRSANDKVDLACIGVGGQGGANLRDFSRLRAGDQPAANIVALCDVDDRRLGEASRRFDKAATYHDFRVLLDEMAGRVDAVVVSTPDHTHAAAVMAALGRGKHVYCEKPLAHSIHEARVLAETAARRKVATQMGNQGRSGDNTRKIVELVRSGAIGPVREVHAWSDRPIWPQGMERRPDSSPGAPSQLHWDEWLGPAPDRPYHPDYLPFRWRGWWDFGSGALGDMGCHVLDPASWALDLGHPTTVEAEGAPRSAESGPRAETITYQFPARGPLPPVTVTWYDGGRKPPKALLPEGEAWAKGGSLLVGDRGKLSIPDDYGGRHDLWPARDFEGHAPPPETIRRSPGHHGDFLEACKDPIGRPACSDFSRSGPLTEMVLLGVVAFRSGRKLEWDGPRMKATNAPEADALIRPACRKGWSLE